MAYIPHTPDDRDNMLSAIGARSIEDLFRTIPENLRLADPLAVPAALSEAELAEHMETLAARNDASGRLVSFLGGGVYDHYVPAAVDALSSRSEFYTAYTPYQPEVAQGTLQVIYEFQSLICRLTGMDVANASMYDCASAVAEATLVALAATGRPHVIVSESVHPRYREVLVSYTQGRDIMIDTVIAPRGHSDVESIGRLVSEQTACVITQSPNFFGQLEELAGIEQAVHGKGGLLINIFYPAALGMCRTPGELGADLAVGEGQSLGNPPNYGGPLLGLLAAKKDFLRRVPGRIVGRTTDKQGQTGYVMTLQTREQHIRREKATSNICTSQALIATRATMYLSLLGRQGFRALAEVCARRAHCLADKIAALDGFTIKYPGPFFNEFVVTCPAPAALVVEAMSAQGIAPGIALSRFFPDCDFDLLVCVTEKHPPALLDRYVAALKELARVG
jgi:glycine dehydrogenase subunit 1